MIRRMTAEQLHALGELAGAHECVVQAPNVVDGGLVLTCLWDGLLPHSRVVLYAGVTPSGAVVTGEDVLEVMKQASELLADEAADGAPEVPKDDDGSRRLHIVTTT